MREADRIHKAYESEIRKLDYQFVHYKKFDYNILRKIWSINTRGSGEQTSYNDVLIMADTETSKKKPDEYDPEAKKQKYKTGPNHVVAWTISIRAYHHNIVTLYGRKPSKMIETILRIHEHMRGLKTVVYLHNLPYDHFFLRKFAYRLYGNPAHQLNVKSQYPIYIEYANGIVIRDSLILSQRKLEKWAEDLDVEHKKAVGKWDYEKIRHQDSKRSPLSKDELDYIEHDTLAGVECLDATMMALKKSIASIPMTATGIPREQTRKRGGRKAHEFFQKIALTLDQYHKFEKIFHGGYTHGNRHFIDTLINWSEVVCRDFASSYPFIMTAFKFPMEKFTPYGKKVTTDFILKYKDEYAFAFKFIAVNIRLKSDAEPMPALQYSKCERTINVILDNGRILAANYVEIYLSEWDLAVIDDQYEWDKHICTEVETAKKDYLPRWFTDYVFESFTNKTFLKDGPDLEHYDPVAYSLAKALVNALYGMSVQKSIKPDIVEDYITGEFNEQQIANEPELYEKYVNKMTSILAYQWGVWVTSAAFYNAHQLAKCCRLPLYMDTDSCYGIDWDLDKVNAYNQSCKDKLIANGYGPVIRNGREYWLGVAESDGDKDTYTEFKYMGAKRYCGRCKADGELHITVAGVPKKKGAKCLKDDINNFHPGFIFDGTITGKKTHVYFNEEKIYIDKDGNETGDSISLIPCDYELDSVHVVNWEELFNEEVSIQIYDEEESL